MPDADAAQAEAPTEDEEVPADGPVPAGVGPKAVLALLALGVVYGDIGTSPLYAMREAFFGPHGVPANGENVLGVLSLITWSLVLVISVKYLGFILRADNRGEGGILALLALAQPHGRGAVLRGIGVPLVLAGLFGASLLYGDGMLTPAISVLSAVEGLSVATDTLEPFVVPLTLLILTGLFLVQRHGTRGIGRVFGPVTLVWFSVLAALGVRGIVMSPAVLGAVNPVHAVVFFAHSGLSGFVVLGAVFLVVTGGEALYADMGHFGPGPIRLGWFVVVLPALLLNYYGQGGLLLSDPSTARAPFYLLAPGWALYPLVGLATMATIIASQAVISGTFSLTMQAVRLGYLPRLRILHTSATERGQIYMPEVNAVVWVGTMLLVLFFQSSSGIAGAYGLAVSLTMVLTTLVFAKAARSVWGWSPWVVAPLVALFLVVDLAFLFANVPKIPAGGWFPLVVAFGAMALFTTWRRGRQVLGRILTRERVPLTSFVAGLQGAPPARVAGTGVFPVGDPDVAPAALQRILQHLRVLPKQVIILSVRAAELAYVDKAARMTVEDLGMGFHRIVADYGFMEQPDIPRLLRGARRHGLQVAVDHATYFLGRERLVPTRRQSGLGFWRERLFSAMSRNAQSATAYFRIPEERVFEVGTQVRLEIEK